MNSRVLELVRRYIAIAAITFACSAAFELRGQDKDFSFRQFREKHRTQLSYEPDKPPPSVFNLIKYKSPIGDMSAYVSPDPGDGKKHPLIIWLVGGFSNSIGSHLWEESDASNDQTAAAYRKAGVLMMFPSLRGGNNNPGKVEVCFGEVDDVITAAEYAKKLPYVDPSRIYLGGHSTGGTLALVVAGSTDLFRAVISFGPVHTVAGYGQDNLPFDGKNTAELIVRAPLACLADIKSRTLVIEGTDDGNVDSLRKLSARSKNPQLHFHEVPGATHFNILAPFNKLLAAKLLADTGNTCEISLTADDIENTAKTVKAER
jgi:dienelactone hydrolase